MSTAVSPSATRVTSFFMAVSNTTTSEDVAAFRPNMRHADGWETSLTIVPDTGNERGAPGVTGLQAHPSSVPPLQSLSTPSPQTSALGAT